MRCDQCRHWKLAEEWEATDVGFGFCEAVRERWRIEDAAVDGLAWPGGPHLDWHTDENGNDVTTDAAWNAYAEKKRAAIRKERAYVVDGSQYMASLYTAPDFFCARFVALAEAGEGR